MRVTSIASGAIGGALGAHPDELAGFVAALPAA
jgi:hypothetical protein